jgi:Fe2+ transport system protein FeoA
MYISLTDAPVGIPLLVKKFIDGDMAQRLGRMGLYEGSEIERLDQEVLVQPVRVGGPGGEAVLGGGMAMKVVVHLDDGRKLPLAEMRAGEAGHVEGITGGPALSRSLEVLGIELNDRIMFLRNLPPMEYITLIETGGRVRLTEGMAAKVWGRIMDEPMQYISAPSGEEFQVTDILGGEKAVQTLGSRGISSGAVIILEQVAPAQSLQAKIGNPVVISSREGLRLFLTPQEAMRILVRKAASADD